MKPYYQEAGITIYHGDCREILPSIKADVLITDPPYGVGLGETAGTGGKHGLSRDGYTAFKDTYEHFVDVIAPITATAINQTVRGAVFVGPHIHELPKPNAIGGIYCPAGCGRHPWGFKTFLPVLFYGVAPNLNLGAKPNVIQSTATAEANGHPCPKPLGWMKWLIKLATLDGETILEPFMGSGTTLVAAKDLGFSAIGIELEERYCEIAANRLRQSVLNFEEVSA